MKCSNGDELMRTEEIHMIEECRGLYQDLVHSLGMGPESEEKPQKKACWG